MVIGAIHLTMIPFRECTCIFGAFGLGTKNRVNCSAWLYQELLPLECNQQCQTIDYTLGFQQPLFWWPLPNHHCFTKDFTLRNPVNLSLNGLGSLGYRWFSPPLRPPGSTYPLRMWWLETLGAKGLCSSLWCASAGARAHLLRRYLPGSLFRGQ